MKSENTLHVAVERHMISIVSQDPIMRSGIASVVYEAQDAFKVRAASVTGKEETEGDLGVSVLVIDGAEDEIIGLFSDCKVRGSREEKLILILDAIPKSVVRAPWLTADGLLLRTSSRVELENAFMYAMRGERYIEHSIFLKSLNELRDPPRHPEALSRMERDVGKLLIAGLSNKDISKELSRSSRTVKLTLSRMMRAFGVKTRLELAINLSEWPDLLR